MRTLFRAADGALRNVVLALALYVPGLALSLLSALAAWLGFAMLDRNGNWSEQIASGGYVAAGVEFLSLAKERALPGTAPAPSLVPAAVLLSLAVAIGVLGILVEAYAYAYLAGGILSRLCGAEAPFRASCRRWLGPMLRYSLLIVPVFIVAIPLCLFAAFLLPAAGINGLLAKIAAFGLLLGLVNGMLEYGRASMVIEENRSTRRALRQGLGSIVRSRTVLPAVLAWLLLGLLGYVFSVDVTSAFVAVPALSIVPALAVHQLAALAGAFIKLLRLSLATELVRAS